MVKRPDVVGDEVAAPEVPPVRGTEDQALAPPGGFEHFCLREYRGVVELAYALSGNRAGAEDIAHEAFLRHMMRSVQAVRWPAGLLVDSFISQPRDRSASEVSGKPLAWLEVRFQSGCRFPCRSPAGPFRH